MQHPSRLSPVDPLSILRPGHKPDSASPACRLVKTWCEDQPLVQANRAAGAWSLASSDLAPWRSMSLGPTRICAHLVPTMHSNSGNSFAFPGHLGIRNTNHPGSLALARCRLNLKKKQKKNRLTRGWLVEPARRLGL